MKQIVICPNPKCKGREITTESEDKFKCRKCLKSYSVKENLA